MATRAGIVAGVAAMALASPAAAMHLGKDAPPGGGSAERIDSVLVVGDSLEVGTGPYLEGELAGVAVSVDARTGRSSAEGLGVLEASLRPEHDAVVFDLGTNDDPGAPEALAANLGAARELAGGRCLVVATLNRPPLNGISVSGLNDAVRRFASVGPRVELVDWQAAVATRPELLLDGVHAGPEGYAYRAQLVAEAIQGCATAALAAAPSREGSSANPDRSPAPSPQPEHNPTVVSKSDLAAAAAYEIALSIASGVHEG